VPFDILLEVLTRSIKVTTLLLSEFFGRIISEKRSSAISRVGSVIVNNAGYNPVGDIPNPWPAIGGDLTNDVAAGSQNPLSGTVYTVRHSPKTIVVTGGDLSQITINGVDTGLIAGVFKLGIGETIAVTYDTQIPTSAVFAE
jgi:hypothetical protein